MEFCNLKEKEVVIDIESGEASHGAHAKSDPFSGSKWGRISLKRLAGGILGFNGSSDGEQTVKSGGISGGSSEYPNETTELLGNKNPGGQQSSRVVSVVEKENEKERRKAGKVKRAPKPPRPPKGPSLDAADMRLLKEISKIAIKKRERMERMKTLKKMRTAKTLSSSSSPSPSSLSSSSSSSSGATISAMFITVFFFLVLILQGLGTSTSSNLTLVGAPQPAPETTGMSPVQFYKHVMSDDGAASIFLPPRSKE